MGEPVASCNGAWALATFAHSSANRSAQSALARAVAPEPAGPIEPSFIITQPSSATPRKVALTSPVTATPARPPMARAVTSAASIRIHGPQVSGPAGSSSVVRAHTLASVTAAAVPSMSPQLSMGVVRSSIRSCGLIAVVAP